MWVIVFCLVIVFGFLWLNSSFKCKYCGGDLEPWSDKVWICVNCKRRN